MTIDNREKLIKLLEIFKAAADEEKKAQELYARCKSDYADNAEYSALFDWLYSQEIKHEKKLQEKYAGLKKKLAA